MKKLLFSALILFIFSLFLSSAIIEKIVLEGNEKVSKDTILFYMKSTENGDFSQDKLRQDFKTLWNTGFFEDIVLEAEDGQRGKIVKIILKENP
ncbi:MAG: outer membrane protein assembly factor BamA, partial [Candidatus Aminicenantes bacterium]|nr:outer membrane protein assembly factor BamA [Candidatus Aminicenantes bacterium]